jgi:hypothetical protein
MEEERPEKATVRMLWLTKLGEYQGLAPGTDAPLYLTLSGSEARDVQLLIERGVIRQTEVGSIAPEDQGLVVAIESSPAAVFALQSRLPGLKIIEQPLANLLRSESPFAWPSGDDRKYCRALVVNLDLNMPVLFEEVDGQRICRLFKWVKKLCVLHDSPRIEWSLLLTLHGEAVWDALDTNHVVDFLRENFAEEPSFAAMARLLLGGLVYDQIAGSSLPPARDLPAAMQQKVLMLYVPKRIAQLGLEAGWRVETVHNLRYGGIGSRAPMVTWIFDFKADPRVAAMPQQIYRQNLRAILKAAGEISSDCTLV